MSFGTKKLLLIISDLERKTLDFMGNSLLPECWNWIVFVRENQFIEAYYCKLRFFLNSKKSWKELLMLSKCFSGSLQKSVIYVSRETFWDKAKFWKKIVTIFWKWVAKLKVFMETSSVSCKNCILRVQKSILRQCLFLKKEVCFTFLGQWPKTLGPSAERLPTTLIKLYITKPEKQAKQIFPCNLRFPKHFQRLSQRRSAIQQILSNRSNKTAF